jgi:TPR repeat protein
VDSLRDVVLESLQRDKQPLENVTVDMSVERSEYHKLALHQLKKLDDPEALYQIADRIKNRIGIQEDWMLGWDIMTEAAHRCHPVALAFCFLQGQGVEKNLARAFELLRASADRGHVSGSRTNSHSIFKLRFSQFSQLNTD